jgi:hypothetical protein
VLPSAEASTLSSRTSRAPSAWIVPHVASIAVRGGVKGAYEDGETARERTRKEEFDPRLAPLTTEAGRR